MGMTGLAAIVAVVALAALGMPVAVSLTVVGLAGLALTGGLGPAGGAVLGLLGNPDVVLVPLVLLLGNIAFYAGFATRVHDASVVMLQGRRGGLAAAAILGCAGFSAAAGASVGSAATLSRIAVPDMLRAGYDPRLAGASVAMGTTLGALLPPSMLLIVWGLLSDTPVGAMFLAGLGPALLSLTGMMAVLWWWTRHDPRAAPLPEPVAIRPAAALRAVWSAPVLFAILVGGIALGLLTAVWAVAICVALSMATGLIQHRLTPDSLWTALRDTLRQTATVLAILIAASLFTALLDGAGSADDAAGWIAANLSPLLAIALLGLAGAAVGLAVEPPGILVLILPFALALGEAWGHDAVWSGIVAIRLVQIAMILPPVGLTVVVIATTVRTLSPGTIFAGVARFLFLDLLILAALVLFPALTRFPG